MESRQYARFDAGKRLQAINADTTYAAQLATISDYAQEETDLNTVILKIEAAQAIQAQDNTGLAVAKDELRHIMAETIAQYNQRAIVKAYRTGNTTLQNDVNHLETYYIEGEADLGISRAKASVKLLSDNLAIFTNILAADITKMNKTITDFSNIKDKPTIAHQTQVVQGSDPIPALLDEMDIYINNAVHLVHSYYPKSTLSDAVDKATKLLILGVRHNIVMIHPIDSVTNLPVTGAKSTNIKNNKTYFADPQTNVITIPSITLSLHTFLTEATGYNIADSFVKAQRGTTTDVIVKMVKS